MESGANELLLLHQLSVAGSDYVSAYFRFARCCGDVTSRSSVVEHKVSVLIFASTYFQVKSKQIKIFVRTLCWRRCTWYLVLHVNVKPRAVLCHADRLGQ